MTTPRTVWQIASGPASRTYADVFLRHGVGLIGPGYTGPWIPGRPDDDYEGGFVRRLAGEVVPGDAFLLRKGLATISAIGLVCGGYQFFPQFDDVNGWDLNHGRRVRWSPLPEEFTFAKEVADGTLGADYDKADRAEIATKVQTAEEEAQDEVWASYRFVVLADAQEPDGLQVIDLGAGHASSKETLVGRLITALKSQALLNESIGAGFLDRNWPKALKDSGAWPLSGLRQCFLNGSLTRLLDPDATLRGKITEFVSKGVFGLASGPKPDGTYDRVWFDEILSPDEVMFDGNVFLLAKAKAKALKAGVLPTVIVPTEPETPKEPQPEPGEKEPGQKPKSEQLVTLQVVGDIPPEVWNRLGTKVIPKLKSGTDLKVGITLTAAFTSSAAGPLETEIEQILSELGLSDRVKVERVKDTAS